MLTFVEDRNQGRLPLHLPGGQPHLFNRVAAARSDCADGGH